MEAGSLVAKAMLTSAQSTEIRCSLRNDVVVELEDDLGSRPCHAVLSLLLELRTRTRVDLPSFTETSKYTSDLATERAD